MVAPPIGRSGLAARLAGASAAAGGAVVLTGWALGSPQLTALLPGAVSMKANTAIGVIALGVSIVLMGAPGPPGRPVRIGRWLSLAVILLGSLTLLEYATGTDLRIDQLLVHDRTPVPTPSRPGRMAPGTALAFIALGYSVIRLRANRGPRHLGEVLSVGVGAIGLVSLMGYAYRAPLLDQSGTSSGMQANAAVLLLMLAWSVIAMTPDGRVARLITSRGLGGLTFRRLLPVAVLVPAVSGGVLLSGQRAGLYSPGFAIAILVALTVTTFTLVLWKTSEWIDRLDGDRRALIEGLERRVGERTAELERSRQHAFRLLEGLPVGVLVLDGGGRPVYANGMAEALLGPAGGTFPAHRAGTDEAYPAERLPVLRALSGEVSQVDDLEIARPDGRVRVEVRATPIIDDDGSIQYAIASYTDVTQRERDHQLLDDRASELEHRAAELEQSNHELEQFAYVASHDLQEPLRMVTSYVQLLEKRYRGRFDADADEYIGFAVDGASRMQTLILDLLAYSRVGRSPEPPGRIGVTACVEAAIGNLRSTIRETGATITFRNLPEVDAGGSELTQLFQNLIANALKFHGEAAPVIDIEATREHGSWLFAVRDNGIGIEPKHSQRIFMVFQRLHTRTAFPGTGIGLAICKKVVERLGGRIWVESQPGRGSTFFFTIPIRRDRAPAGRPGPRRLQRVAEEAVPGRV